MDYFLLGAVKEQGYADKPKAKVKANIRNAISEMQKWVRSNEVLCDQPRQQYEWNNIPLLNGTI